MISFYPGPSRVYDKIPVYVQEAHRKGILSLNHRSPGFMDLAAKTVALLKEKLDIPTNYAVLFASSATECWEIIAQSLITQKSIHLFNGAFGEKWFDYTHRLHGAAVSVPFDLQMPLDPTKMIFDSGEILCVTQNETSNGTQVSNPILSILRKQNPNHLLAVDATSSMAGIQLDFSAADVWFASVQKCFGLPAGLAVIVISPNATEAIQRIGENLHYNSLGFMQDMMAKWQTPCTPNVLGIYLLMRTLEARQSIEVIDQKTKERAERWHALLEKSSALSSLVVNPQVQSHTVIAVKADPRRIEKIKTEATTKGFLLGEGYGALKKDTFRIANFPALQQKEIVALMRFLSRYT
jgi:phosphoserine aminotransferase